MYKTKNKITTLNKFKKYYKEVSFKQYLDTKKDDFVRNLSESEYTYRKGFNDCLVSVGFDLNSNDEKIRKDGIDSIKLAYNLKNLQLESQKRYKKHQEERRKIQAILRKK